MESTLSRTAASLGVQLAALVVIVAPAAAVTCESPAATVVSVQGTVDARRVGAAEWQPVSMDEKLCAGDSVRTAVTLDEIGNTACFIQLGIHFIDLTRNSQVAPKLFF